MQNDYLLRLAEKLQEIMGVDPKIKGPYECYADMARQMVYACEFDAAVTFASIPDYELPEDARKYIIGQVLKEDHFENWPPEILKAKGLLLADEVSTSIAASNTSDSVDATAEDATDYLPLPPMPHVLEIMTRKEPIEYRAPMIIGLLPVMGTLATGVRFSYNKVEEHSLSFFSCLEAPSAGGKSFIKRHVDLLLTPIAERDIIERRKDEEYREALRKARNSKNQPEDPKACIRIQGVVSRSSLLKALSNAGGKHIFSFFPEIATLVNQRKRGAWSDIDDFLRMAFDNDEYRQAYMSTESFSGCAKLYSNMLVTGTPHSRREFFRDIEGGLIQRTAFAILPDEFGKPNPVRLPYTESEATAVVAVAKRLEQQTGTISCPELERAIKEWCDEKGVEALALGSHARDMFRKRSAVIGYRAGMLCYLLEGSFTRKVIPFATWVAEYVFRTQLKLFGTDVEALFNVQSSKGSGSKLLDVLPSPFTKEEMKEAYIQMGGKAENARKLLHQWLNVNKKIRVMEDGRYEKVA